jgi:hypothetical protein
MAAAPKSANAATTMTGPKPMVNAAIPPLCKAAVAKFTKQYPNMLIMDLIKKGGLRFSDVQVGGRGDCTNFVIAKNFEKAMAAMKLGSPTQL